MRAVSGLVVRTLGAICALTLSCGSPCAEPHFEPGTRFRVTVQNDESVCSGWLTFTAGQSFEITAGPTHLENGCKQSPAADPPPFETDQFKILGRSAGFGTLGISCIASVPTCDAAPFAFVPSQVPEGREKLSTTYRIIGDGGNGCGAPAVCEAAIPVTIQRI
jgi:hypothetical protein